MRFTSTLKKLSVLFMVFGALLMLSSCGAYQYVGYDNDGIYSSYEVVVDVNKAATNSSFIIEKSTTCPESASSTTTALI